MSLTTSEAVRNLTVSTGSVTLCGSGSFVVAAPATWAADAGTTLVVQPNISAASLFTIGGAGTSTFSGVLSGSGGLTKSGNGLLTITGARAAAEP